MVFVYGQATQFADGVQRREGLVHSDGEAGRAALQLLLDIVGLTITFMGREEYIISFNHYIIKNALGSVSPARP